MPEIQGYEQKIQNGLDLPDDKKFYFNGVSLSIGLPDVIIVLEHHDKPVAFLNTSHSTAKTMLKLLQNLLEEFEKKTDQKIYTFDEYQEKLKDDTP